MPAAEADDIVSCSTFPLFSFFWRDAVPEAAGLDSKRIYPRRGHGLFEYLHLRVRNLRKKARSSLSSLWVGRNVGGGGHQGLGNWI